LINHANIYFLFNRIDEIVKSGQIALVPDYYASVYNQTYILFQPTPNSKTGHGNKQDVKIILDRTASYIIIANKLASHLKVEASKIRFTSSHPITNQPRDVIHYKPGTRLEEMLPNLPKPNEYAQFVRFENVNTPVMYYEVMDVDVADLESKRSIDVNIIGPTLRKETKVTVLVSRVGSVHQLLDQVIAKGKMDIKDPSKIRLFEAVDGKVTKEFSPDQTVDNVAVEKQAVVYAEVRRRKSLKSGHKGQANILFFCALAHS
jgi:ubiquitin carboxyl-terminal hydrolase 7